MNIELNGKPHRCDAGITAAQLIEQLGFGGKRLAMEINEEILPRSQHASHILCENDRVEIVHAIGGG
ncbi:MAG: sulfur carrier protein ThiS [Gammaproteobacteria bacterium]|nr:sulfur carrier protein ThiS [Gammaproteobacteria bacterium]